MKVVRFAPVNESCVPFFRKMILVSKVFTPLSIVILFIPIEIVFTKSAIVNIVCLLTA